MLETMRSPQYEETKLIWVSAEELRLSYYDKGTLSFIAYRYSGSLTELPQQQPSNLGFSLALRILGKVQGWGVRG